VYARLIVVVDFPTPPLQELTAITFRTNFIPVPNDRSKLEPGETGDIETEVIVTFVDVTQGREVTDEEHSDLNWDERSEATSWKIVSYL